MVIPRLPKQTKYLTILQQTIEICIRTSPFGRSRMFKSDLLSACECPVSVTAANPLLHRDVADIFVK